MDNERLKELMKDSPGKKNHDEFFQELLNSSLFLPVDIDSESLDFSRKDLGKDVEGDIPVRFAPIIAKQEGGNAILPLFTDSEEGEKFGHSSFISVGCEEVAAILIQTEDVDEVVINPLSKGAVGMTADSFLDLVSATKIREIEDLITKGSRPLKSEARFYLREEVPLMRDLAEDRIFTSKLPFNAYFKDNFDERCSYLNILIVPKGIRFLYVGKTDGYGDSVFPPTIRFKLIGEEGNVFTWKCISQELNVKPKRQTNAGHLLLAAAAAIVLAAIVLFLLG